MHVSNMLKRGSSRRVRAYCYHVCTIIFILFHPVYGAPEEVVFADEEWELFERRVEEGYDLCPSGRYLLWLRMYYPHLVFEGGYTPELKATMYMYMYIHVLTCLIIQDNYIVCFICRL